jgi:hypothetical protein
VNSHMYFVLLVIQRMPLTNCLTPSNMSITNSIFLPCRHCLILSVSDSVMVVPSVAKDFLDYDARFDDIYRPLAVKVKQNHLFSCSGNNLLPVIELRASNLDEHQVAMYLSKKSQNFNSALELKAHSSTLLLPIKCLGMNPYKMVQMWKNYRPMVSIEYQDDELYAKPDAKVMANVKDEKVYRAKSRAILKAKKYGGVKDTSEDIAFGDCETENKG